MQTFSLKQFSKEDKMLLLKELGYQSDGKFVLNDSGETVIDKYLEIPVRIDKMLIFPGSTIILDDNELSVSMYISEYGDPFK